LPQYLAVGTVFGNGNPHPHDTRKELEFMKEAKRYRLDIVSVPSTKRRGFEMINLFGGRKLFVLHGPYPWALASRGGRAGRGHAPPQDFDT